jgi:PiT family inorganic phosphate transporter
LTWWFGIPSSSSHALIGSLAGAVVAKGGFSAFNWAALQRKVLVPLVSSPAAGFFIALSLMIALTWLIPTIASGNRQSPGTASAAGFIEPDGVCARLERCPEVDGHHHLALLSFVASGGAWSCPAGVDAAQAGRRAVERSDVGHHCPAPAPLRWELRRVVSASSRPWAPRSSASRRCKAVSPRLPVASRSCSPPSWLGIPVSTTHCISASIMGVGAAKRLSAVRWGVAGNIVTAWVLTVPISGAVSFGMYRLLAYLFASS